MKIAHKTALLTAALVTCGSLVNEANAGVVFQIDVSNPSAVTITATTAVSESDSSLNIGTEGITIENFLTSSTIAFPLNTAFTGDLSPSGTAVAYNFFGTFEYEDNDGAFKAGNDLSVYSGTAGTQDFSTSTTAFTGVATFDFSSASTALPSVGTTGNVISGFLMTGGPAGHGNVVGQWTVVSVPEPSSVFLLGLGYLGFALRRSR